MMRAILFVCFAAVLLGAAAAGAAPRELTDEDVSATVKAVIAERTRGGIFPFTDARTGDQLSLVLDDVRIVRGLPGYGWFPNVNFHAQDNPAKKYALDFWLKPDGDRLKLMDIRIHKATQLDGGAWMSITRAPLAWWWLPTIERASAVAGVQAWQVMGDIHAHIAATKNGEAIELRDAGGRQLSLQLVDIDPPVGRSKAGGRYFACALLRKFGNPAAFYSTAYWLDAKTKLVTAGSVKEVDAASGGESKAAAEPRCDVEGIAFDVVD